MALGRSHGRTYPEVSSIADLPEGVAVTPPAELPGDRDGRGRFRAGNSLTVRGNAARRGKTRLAEKLGLREQPEDENLRRHLRSAKAFRAAYCADLARNVGGGHLGPGPSSLVASAALQLAYSRALADQAIKNGGDPDLVMKASKLADASRTNLLAAHELAALEARARASAAPSPTAVPWLAAAPAATDPSEPTMSSRSSSRRSGVGLPPSSSSSSEDAGSCSDGTEEDTEATR